MSSQCFPLRRPKAAFLYLIARMGPKFIRNLPGTSFSASRVHPSGLFLLRPSRTPTCQHHSSFTAGFPSHARNGIQWHCRHRWSYWRLPAWLPDGNLRFRIFWAQHIDVVRACCSTRRGKFCAVVDASDALDPKSVAAAGIELDRLLWIRCGENSHHAEHRLEQLLRVTDLLLESGGFGLIAQGGALRRLLLPAPAQHELPVAPRPPAARLLLDGGIRRRDSAPRGAVRSQTGRG